MPSAAPQPCRICQAGQRISTFTFLVFGLGLAFAAADPAETPLRQGALAICAVLSCLAAIRFPIARMVGWYRERRLRRGPNPLRQVRKQNP
ncbi:hypothetical protein [Pseudotabrizicola algicola]|uniref:Uncharacterized protein n=1 Tax=Pseudotabrizicola algicola TaxID=2709381 RepID=A0A6B3RJB9_9RHOB|nr:hypothetical protein [Pseudotabrizicola algicola]NEX45276.1 hypothetical protein [Pseudotabrizicola algicola]